MKRIVTVMAALIALLLCSGCAAPSSPELEAKLTSFLLAVEQNDAEAVYALFEEGLADKKQVTEITPQLHAIWNAQPFVISQENAEQMRVEVEGEQRDAVLYLYAVRTVDQKYVAVVGGVAKEDGAYGLAYCSLMTQEEWEKAQEEANAQ